ncbi:MAG: hypothetical protein EBT09_11930 [Actinobacteria bacterium]|nr:hypothetical protein [Actinomycetota bacterium]
MAVVVVFFNIIQPATLAFLLALMVGVVMVVIVQTRMVLHNQVALVRKELLFCDMKIFTLLLFPQQVHQQLPSREATEFINLLLRGVLLSNGTFCRNS